MESKTQNEIKGHAKRKDKASNPKYWYNVFQQTKRRQQAMFEP